MAKEAWIDQEKIRESLSEFFDDNRGDLETFGRTVNQTFEAFVFAAVTAWYRERDWKIEFRHPRQNSSKLDKKKSLGVRLKFSTKGRPGNYSYVVCTKGEEEVHIRHQLRVATRYHTSKLQYPANVCLDVAVIKPVDLCSYSSEDFVENRHLVTFGEAKHMSAFAELVANFVGLVHEMQPGRLRRKKKVVSRAMPPFLYVSGFLFRTAQGINESLDARGYDIQIYSRTEALAKSVNLPGRMPANRKRKSENRIKANQIDLETLPF
ncbi:hypothetical protein C5Y96_05510 [Blastopirellula marina]|uniref:Uncharacterized protein n=1 Tax=Blastopirellula marina TaxID=124 RepID=A0A2S8G4W6_9BACT|nr:MULTISPECIES: hypothetical protein [Pirellulaceae]PQO39311.1 hypothetical protein C5Y96_05510 [Blastopirellula marina]RCS55619.1 hypothetical protein DTL36_05520 [Bremerella cremea]